MTRSWLLVLIGFGLGTFYGYIIGHKIESRNREITYRLSSPVDLKPGQNWIAFYDGKGTMIQAYKADEPQEIESFMFKGVKKK